MAGISFAASSRGGTGDRANVEHLEARLGEGEPVLGRPLGRSAAGALEHRVVGDVDDPDADGLLELERPIPELPLASHIHH